WFHAPERGAEGDFEALDVSWFGGGRINACHNRVDRHADATPDRVAIVWARNEPGVYDHITFRELKREVARFANVLLAHGIRRGDRVCLYMPMIPELAYAVLACARIGAVHSVVFAGFSADSLRGRVLDAEAAVVVTANEGLRGDKTIPLKRVVDEAVAGLEGVRSVLVARRTAADVPMRRGRDHWLDVEMARQRPVCPIAWMDAEDPLFLLYTSGSTGKPKGLVHTVGGYLTFVASTFRWAFEARPGDIHFCTADIGWITGHSYILYGPLANGVTTVIFESTPTWPDAGRLWQVVDDVGATTCYTAPTALRSLIRAGDEPVKRHRRTSLRVLGSVGEPINPEVWKWFHDVVGEGRCAVVDTWWQTETGGILIAPFPGATPAKPGSATLPLPGVRPVLLDEEGKVVEGNGVRGNLCLAG
ncbi:MAG: AMP-binding protein, partial [Myxococcota bacterium]